MMDPGHPFTVNYEDLIESLEDSILHGVRTPWREKFTYRNGVTTYRLHRTVHAITRVSGMRGGNFGVFDPGVHFRLSNNGVAWIDPEGHPDDNTKFEVEYTYRVRPAGLNDLNPGSVTGTMLRAVARELRLMYAQMDEAYRRAFVDPASGIALDNVVALLGVARNEPIKASGLVTFFRKKKADSDIAVPLGTRVADESGRVFVTTGECVIEAETVELVIASGGSLKVDNRIAELVGIWNTGDDLASDPPIADQNTPDLQIGEDERTITLAALPDGELPVRYKPKSVTVAVEAQQPGPEGNVNAETLTIMPTPPAGIDGVTNEDPIEGGLSAESDDRLRDRAKHALERSGNATLNAIKFAVLDVDGVEGVEVVDHHSDDTVPLGEVRVRFSGGDPVEVREAVEDTRAAGILVRYDIINTVLISGDFCVIPEPVVTEAAAGEFLSRVVTAIEELVIGESLSMRRLSALVYQTAGLADVAEVQLRFKKADTATPGQFIEGSVTDPFLIEATELIRPDASRLNVVLLTALHISGTRKEGANHVIDVQLLDSQGTASTFDALEIDVTVTIKASLTAAPDQPSKRIDQFTSTVLFTGASIGTLVIRPADTTGFRPADHDPLVEVVLSASAYPGLQEAQTLIDLSP